MIIVLIIKKLEDLKKIVIRCIKTILITGSAGFIGFHLSKKILSLGLKVVGVDNLNDYYDKTQKRQK